MARQNFIGLVVSQGKMSKTVKVRVQNQIYDKLVNKEVYTRKDYLVHDEGDLCREGDIVRIEQIPKRSARKFFAVAEIKANKGQQFTVYEKLSKEKVAEEEKERIAEFFAKREQLTSTIKHLDDLRRLDSLATQFGSGYAATEEERQSVLTEIAQIKEKYNIKSWPSTEPLVELEIQKEAKQLLVVEQRLANIQSILNKLMEDSKYQSIVDAALSHTKRPAAELSPRVKKNILRKWVLNEENELPAELV